MLQTLEQQETTRRLRDQSERIAALEGRADNLARELSRALDKLAGEQGRAAMLAADAEMMRGALDRQAEHINDMRRALQALAITTAIK